MLFVIVVCSLFAVHIMCWTYYLFYIITMDVFHTYGMRKFTSSWEGQGEDPRVRDYRTNTL